MGKITAMMLKNAAEGEYGPQIEALYWFLVGKKAWLGLILGGIGAALMWGDTSGSCLAVGLTWCGDWGAKVTLGVGVVMGYLSQVDSALRMARPGRVDW